MHEWHSTGENLIDAITKIYHNKNHIFRDEIASIYLESVVGKNKDSSRKEEIFGKFVKLVMKHHKQERKVSFYAYKLCITPKYLSEVVKAKTKKTPVEWVNKNSTFPIPPFSVNILRGIPVFHRENIGVRI
ncbi:hypothetical protein R83H12_00229 [Fibrobacteria bacterium R8-3-H12]